MGIFSGGEKAPPAAPATGRSGAAGATGLSIIGTGMTVYGDVETGGVVKIEGTVNGQVKAGQQVLVAKGGRIDGDVETGEAVVAGSVHGAVHAAQRVEIQAGAVVEGDVTTNRILVAEGAVLNGAVRMGDAEQVATPAPARPVAQPVLPRPSAPLASVAVPPRANTPP
jgi:cytoskeletal protein CcmA (bactofilin family)